MQKYKNLGGNSSIQGYEFKPDGIEVYYSNGAYLYNFERPGQVHIENMKKLAEIGKGLNSYIQTHVRKNYARKL